MVTQLAFFSSFSRDEKVFGVYCRVCVCVTVCMCVTDSTVVWWLALSPHSREVQGPSVWRLDVLSGHLGFKDTL